jgi:hypothetical protein
MSLVDAETLKEFLCISHDVEQAMNPTWPLVRARALARAVGRTSGLDNLQGAVVDLTEAWSRQYQQRRRWGSVVDWFVAGAPEEVRRVPRSRIDANLRHVLHSAVGSCLVGELVLDVADTELRLTAAGPWESATSPDGRPGPEWNASDEVLARIRAVVSDLSAHEMAMIGARHAGAVGVTSGPARRNYVDLVSRMAGFSFVTASRCPAAVEMVSDAVRPLLVNRWIVDAVKGTGRTRYALDDWLTCLAVVLVHRAHFTADQVRAFAAQVDGVLPDLLTVLDEPL